MRALVVLSLLVAPLAGCVAPDAPAETGIPPSDAYTLTTTGLLTTVTAGEPFSFTLDVSGPTGWTSDHVGAHYGSASSQAPSVEIYPTGCDHNHGDLPGTFTVECTVTDPGTIYLRGHVRVSQGDEMVSFWSEETEILVEAPASEVPSYHLMLEDVPQAATVGQAVNFKLMIHGPAGWSSDHLGAHYGPNASDTASTEIYPTGCDHNHGDLPGTFTVTCVFDEEGSVHLRGHARVLVDEEPHNFWSDEVVIEVQAVA